MQRTGMFTYVSWSFGDLRQTLATRKFQWQQGLLQTRVIEGLQEQIFKLGHKALPIWTNRLGFGDEKETKILTQLFLKGELKLRQKMVLSFTSQKN